jgi:hypothetical protein
MHRSAAPADRPCTGFRVRSLLSTRPTRSDSDPSQSPLPRAIALLQSSGSLPARHERTAISGRYPAEGCADQSPICSCARREPVADGDRQRAETAAHCRVREDLEHCRAPSAAGAVALRTQAWTKRAGTGAHSCVREDFEHCRALSGAPAAPAQRPLKARVASLHLHLGQPTTRSRVASAWLRVTASAQKPERTLVCVRISSTAGRSQARAQ